MPSLIIGKNDILTVNPQLAKEWNSKKNDPLQPNMVAIGSVKKVWWICSKGHEWLASPNNRNHGNGCPYCAGKIPILGETDLKSQFPKIAKEWNYKKNKDLIPESFTIGSQKKVWWICAKGHEWETSINHRVRGEGCPVCNAEKSTSFPEQSLYFYIRMIFPDVINRYRPKWLVGKNNNHLEIDIYIPSLKLGIEYDGQNFHRDSSKDVLKDKIINSHCIKLIRIREPKCPILNSTSICFFIQTTKGLFYFENAIKSVLEYIKSFYKLSFDINVDIKRDYTKIINSYEHVEKTNSLIVNNPLLVEEWDYFENGTLLPQYVTCGSNKQIWWHCKKCGFKWQDSIKHRTSGRGCPNCAKHNRIVTRRESLLEVGKSLFDWCKKNPEWGEIILQEWSDKNSISPKEITYGSSEKVWWICKNGHEWEASVNNRVRKSGCPYCTNKLILTGYNDFATLYPELSQEWLFEKNTIEPTKIGYGSNKRVWWKCKSCGYEWETAIANRTKNHTGCPYCKGRVVISGKNDFGTLFPQLLMEWDYNKNSIDPYNISPGTDKKVWWICNSCGKNWYASVGERTRGHGCPSCSKKHKIT